MNYLAIVVDESENVVKYVAINYFEQWVKAFFDLNIDQYDLMTKTLQYSPAWHLIEVFNSDYSVDLDMVQQDGAFPEEYLPTYRPDLEAVKKAEKESSAKWAAIVEASRT